MKRVLLLSVFLLFLNCEDKQSKNKNIINSSETKEDTIENKTSKKVASEDEYPVLDDENAVPFFSEYEKENKENKVRITTDFGAIDILLYENTKYHRANFIYLTKRHYFDDTQFYRVINDFVVQGGNSDDKKIGQKRVKIGRYLLPPDTNKGYKHNRGVISMPSSDIENPYKLASPFEFFIVQQQGGSHFLDGNYTIFGEVIKGMDVVDKMAAVKTDEADWPLENIYIRKVEIIQ